MVTENLKISTENTVYFNFHYDDEYTVVKATYDNTTYKLNNDFSIIEGDLGDYYFVDSEIPKELENEFEKYIANKIKNNK